MFGTVEGTDYELKLVFNKHDEPQPLKKLKIQTIKHKNKNRYFFMTVPEKTKSMGSRRVSDLVQ